MLILAKILITFLTVVFLTACARRLGPAWAGVLAGFPLGSAITLYFMGYELGTEFAAKGAVQALIGLVGCLTLAATYFMVSQRWPASIFRSALASIVAFCASAAVLQYWEGAWWLNLIVIVTSIVLARYWLGHIADHPVTLNPENLWQRPLPAILFRATSASASVLAITTLAHWLQPAQAGLLAAFPVSFFPVLIVLHLSYGAPVVATTIRQYPEGLGAMAVYVLAVSFCYPLYGLNNGTAISLAAALAYLAVYTALRHRSKHR